MNPETGSGFLPAGIFITEHNMTIQEANELVLSKVPEEKKEAFIEAITACGKKADKTAVLEKFSVQLTAEELEAISANKLSDEALDEAAGGCMCCCDECCAMGSWEA